jgi:hypothetical protein
MSGTGVPDLLGYRGSVDRWKQYQHELADLFAALPPVDG